MFDRLDTKGCPDFPGVVPFYAVNNNEMKENLSFEIMDVGITIQFTEEVFEIVAAASQLTAIFHKKNDDWEETLRGILH